MTYLEKKAAAQSARGFTLVESLVAIAIVALSISGPLWAAGNSLRAAQVAQDQLTASSLSQEAVEYVRAIRDDDYLNAYNKDKTTSNASTDAWTAFLSDVSGCGKASGGCEMHLGDWDHPYPSSTGQPLVPCSAGGASCNSPLQLTSGSQNVYNRVSGVATAFTRIVTVDSVGTTYAPVEQVVSTVTWSLHGSTYHVSTTDDLTPWQ